ncbi:MAG: hypothetical protein BV457_07210 [Thermoplasmata archaeon M9B1D]|nr:MAG: hypothetical protein BV457_07210 [Thermoplasmata archaeon M9B1D]
MRIENGKKIPESAEEAMQIWSDNLMSKCGICLKNEIVYECYNCGEDICSSADCMKFMYNHPVCKDCQQPGMLKTMENFYRK